MGWWNIVGSNQNRNLTANAKPKTASAGIEPTHKNPLQHASGGSEVKDADFAWSNQNWKEPRTWTPKSQSVSHAPSVLKVIPYARTARLVALKKPRGAGLDTARLQHPSIELDHLRPDLAWHSRPKYAMDARDCELQILKTENKKTEKS